MMLPWEWPLLHYIDQYSLISPLEYTLAPLVTSSNTHNLAVLLYRMLKRRSNFIFVQIR